MPVLVRYWLFQIPELLVLVGGAGLLVWLDYVAWYWVAVVAAIDVLKDALLYRWLRSSYRTEPSGLVGAERLLGSRGIAVEALEPEGFVRVTGELWRAQTADGQPLPAGAPVLVRSVHGLTLVVSSAPAPERQRPPSPPMREG